MSANGEISVAVQAEGVDDATGDLGGEGLGGDGPDAPDGGGGGGGGIGRMGSILTRILGLIAFLGPIFDVLKAASSVLTAFVAPLAVLLIRLLAPAMRLLIFILPVWLEFVGLLTDAIGVFNTIRRAILQTLLSPLIDYLPSISGFLREVRNWVQKIPRKLDNMINDLRNLPSRLSNLLPSVGGEGGLVDRGRDFLGLGDNGGGNGGTQIAIGGGLAPFIDELTRDGSVDFP